MTKDHEKEFEAIRNNLGKFCNMVNSKGFWLLNETELRVIDKVEEMYRKGYELKIVNTRRRRNVMMWVKKPASVEVLTGVEH